MNLIEQLGGYEKAKNIRLGNEEDWMFYSTRKEWYSDIKHDESFIFIDDLKYQLAQYRRENNIFEVGDYIVDTVSNQFFRIIEIDGCDLLIEQMFWVNSLYQRHATPAEIQAGKRLN